jgi:hypothetical protein
MRIIGFINEALAVRQIRAYLNEATSLTYMAPDRHRRCRR